MKTVKFLVSGMLVLYTSALRIAQINDVHISLDYNQSCSLGLCIDIGNYLMDPPIKLLDTVLGDMKYYYDSSSQPIDAVTIGGDFVVHGLSNGDPDHKNWPQMMQVIEAVIQSV